jgi:hypothetical protein
MLVFAGRVEGLDGVAHDTVISVVGSAPYWRWICSGTVPVPNVLAPPFVPLAAKAYPSAQNSFPPMTAPPAPAAIRMKSRRDRLWVR